MAITPAPQTPPIDPRTWPAPEDADVRLVVTDMDGTLLDADGRLPEGIWRVLDALEERGIAFVPTSGRQSVTLSRMFAPTGREMTVIAENGAVIMRGDDQLFAAPLDPESVAQAIRAVRERRDCGEDIGIVAACARTALVERSDPRFLEAARPCYNEVAVVGDLLEALGAPGAPSPVKLALFDFTDVSGPAEEVLGRFRGTHQVVFSTRNWADLTARGVGKDRAVAVLQSRLGIGAAQTAAFGDYLNDVGMLGASGLSFAMANAHPDALAAARYVAPPNTRGGVLTVLRAILGLRD
jgi:hydroxymethylpyrimidine pyrophosphatase-like HAD family hydrolase